MPIHPSAIVPVAEGVIAEVTHFCTSGPKGIAEYIYGPETDVYRTARAGELVRVDDNGGAFSWDNRRIYSCHALTDNEQLILYADDLIGVQPISL
jgi:hypothetical protein